MTTPSSPADLWQAAVDAALVVLKSMGLSLDDLTAAPRERILVPTFAEYVPVVSATVSDGTRRAYGTYWNRVVEHWGDRRSGRYTPPAIHQSHSFTHVKLQIHRLSHHINGGTRADHTRLCHPPTGSRTERHLARGTVQFSRSVACCHVRRRR
jgi:hypothetical protein